MDMSRNMILMVVRVPVHVVELDRSDPHLVAEAGHHHDPALRRLDTFEKEPAQQEVAVVVRAEHALMAVYG